MKKPGKTAPNLQLKRAREQKGWSQEYVAREVGTDAFTVSRWERGVTLPSPYFRQQLSTLLGRSAAELGLVPHETNEPSDRVSSQPDVTLSVSEPVLDPGIPPSPAGEHSLVGRDELLRQLKQRLLDGGRVALSALNGLPGVGKTALATALAHDTDVRAHFSDGVLWAGLGTNPDILGLLSRWGTLLGCAPADLTQRNLPQAWAASIHAAIGQRRFLLVIDDAWELAQALTFLVGGPNSAHLITTRFPEIARRFAADGTIVVRELENTDGRMLLMRLASDVVQAEPEEAQALVSAVGGLPLALTLLGNYLRAQTHSGQPRRLRAALERLHNIDERLRLAEPQPLIGGHPSLSAGTPLSLQAMIGISDQQLSEEAQVTLRALAAFPPKPNTFSETAAIAVSALPVETLDELTDAGLLESSGPERYTLHQTIADYTRAHLDDTTATERFVTYFVTYAESHASDNALLESESSNILAALKAALERGMLVEQIRGIHAFVPLLITRGDYSEAETHLQRSLEATRSLEDIGGQATTWLHLGKIAEQRGDFEQAYAQWQNGLNLARQSSQDGLIAETLKELGQLARQQGQPEQAHQFLEEALVFSRQAGDRRREGAALRTLGVLTREQGQPERARQLYEEALTISRQAGNQGEVARVLNNLGVLARQQGQPEQARRLLEEALDIFRQLEDRRGAAITSGNLGRIAENQGQPERARRLYGESLAAFEQLGDRRSAAQVLHNLGTLAWVQGQPEHAHKLFEEALDILRLLGDRRTAALTVGELGYLAREQGQLEQSHRLLEEALGTFRQLADRREVAVVLRELGALARSQQQPELARQLLQESLDTLRQLGDRRESSLTLRELGMLARGQGQLEQARQSLDEVLHAFRQLADSREVAHTLRELGALVREQGQLEQAHQFLIEALETLRELGDRRGVALTLRELGILARQRDHLDEALHLLLSSEVGLTLVDSPDARAVEEMLGQVRAQVGKDVFNSIARQTAREMVEPAYGLAQSHWATILRQLITRVPPA